MRRMTFAAFVGWPATAAMGQAAAVEFVRFDGAMGQVAELAGDRATLFDDSGKAVLQGSSDFVRRYAGSKDGTVLEWDLEYDRVRISPAGAKGAWLSCADLKPMTVACSTRLEAGAGGVLTIKRRGDGSGGRGIAEDAGKSPAGALPMCPGDPRCPKL